MNHCLISYEPCGDTLYSSNGLMLLSRSLKELKELPFSAVEQRREAVLRAEKISIQGVQPKLSVKLNVRQQGFELTDTGGTFILKPQHNDFVELPENEAITMRLAAVCGIDVPLSGLVKSNDGSLTYFIKRFDRLPKGQKLAVEDFAQLTGSSRDTKYSSSMEKLGDVIAQCCSFPTVEHIKLFRLTLFNFLIGNEDAHLKNFSLITRKDKVELSPAYDLVNSTIILRGSKIEELALPLEGKKRKLTKEIFIRYGKNRLKLSEKTIEKVFQDLADAQTEWQRLLDICFLSEEMKEKYKALLEKRLCVLNLRKI
jgi:serine/threonine-protein kinase HipA